MLAKKVSLIFCLFKTGGGRGGGRQNQNCLQKPENELMFYDTSESKKNTGKLRSKLPINILLKRSEQFKFF